MGWHQHNLTMASGGAPGAIESPVSHVFDAEGTQHVFYRALLGTDQVREALVELWWKGGDAPRWDDLFAGLTSPARDFSIPPLASHVVDVEGTQHIFYQGDPGRIYELWWRGSESPHAGDLCLQSGEALLGGRGLASHVFDAEGTQHVYFVASGRIGGQDATGHVVELWWRGGVTPHAEDLTRRSGTTLLPDSPLTSHVFDAEGTQHVFYRAGRDIVELSWGDGQDWHGANLSDRSAGEAEPAASAPTSHVHDAEGTQHVFYTADNAHVIELSWRSGQDPVARDLSAHSHGAGPVPLAVSAPTSHVLDAEGTQHVYYISDAGHVIELWWPVGGDPQHEDLSDQIGGVPLATGLPASHVFRAEGTQHVFFASTAREIIELWWRAS